MKQELFECFYHYFEIIEADTDELRDEVYRLRYQIYCIENNFENPDDFPDKREADRYDKRSIHALIRHKQSGLNAATVRLVLNDLEAEAIFPIETHCYHGKEQPARLHIEEHCLRGHQAYGIDLDALPRKHIAEISRFAISKHFKRRIGEATTEAGVGSDTELFCQQKGFRLLPHISLGLLSALLKMSKKNDIHYWYAIMEPSLLRLLSQFGVQFMNLGGLVEYFGKRQPCFADVKKMSAYMHENRREVWDLLTDKGKVCAMQGEHPFKEKEALSSSAD